MVKLFNPEFVTCSSNGEKYHFKTFKKNKNKGTGAFLNGGFQKYACFKSESKDNNYWASRKSMGLAYYKTQELENGIGPPI